MPKCHRAIQRNRPALGKAADPEAAQFGDVAEGSQRLRQVAGEGADIGALADHSLEIGVIRVGRRQEAQLGDLDRAGSHFGRAAGAGQRIGAPAGDLDRRIGRRALQDPAGEGGERRGDRRRVRSRAGFGNDRALAIVGVGLGAPGDPEAVDFAARGDELDGLGRFAQGQRQDPGRQRVEGAGMPDLCPGAAPHQRDRPRRGDAIGLVDDQPAVHPARHPGVSWSRHPAPAAGADRARPRGGRAAPRCGRHSRRRRRARRGCWGPAEARPSGPPAP